MPRQLSSIAPEWWDYTTLDAYLIRDAAALTPEKMRKLSRPGFQVLMYDRQKGAGCRCANVLAGGPSESAV